MGKEERKIFNDKDRMVISGNDIDSIFIDEIDFESDDNYPIVNIASKATLDEISRNSKNYNNLKRDKNTDILSISGENIDTTDDIADIESSLSIDTEINNKNNEIPQFDYNDILLPENNNTDESEDFNGVLSQIDLDNAIISYDENEDDNNFFNDNYDNSNSENEKLKQLSDFFEDVISKLSKNKREEVLNSNNYKNYLSIINKK